MAKKGVLDPEKILDEAAAKKEELKSAPVKTTPVKEEETKIAAPKAAPASRLGTGIQSRF